MTEWVIDVELKDEGNSVAFRLVDAFGPELAPQGVKVGECSFDFGYRNMQFLCPDEPTASTFAIRMGEWLESNGHHVGIATRPVPTDDDDDAPLLTYSAYVRYYQNTPVH